MSNSAELGYYPVNMGVGDIIGQSWRLYRSNFNKIIIYTILPTIIYAMFQAFMQIIPLFLAKAGNSFPAITLSFFLGVIAFFIFLLTAFVSNFAMSNSTHNIIMGRNTNFKQVINFLRKNFVPISKLIGIIFAEIIVFAIIDFIIMMALTTIISFNISLISTYLRSFEAALTIIFIIMILFIFIFAGVFVGLEALFIILQIVIFSNGKSSIWYSLEYSKNIILSERNKSYYFVFLLFSIWYILIFYLNLPISFLSYIPIIQGNTEYYQNFPFIIIIITFWSNITGMLLWPLIVCSINMYYYQWEIKHRGIDLMLKLMEERNQT